MIIFKKIGKGEKTVRNNKGVTLIALVVTIVVMLIIAGTSVYTGMNSLEDAKEESLKAELNMMKQVVLENYTKFLNTQNEKYLVGTEQDYENVFNKVSPIGIDLKAQEYSLTGGTGLPEEYYYEIEERDYETLQISKPEGNINKYIVNYSTGEVINIGQIDEGNATSEKIDLIYTYAVQNKQKEG